MLRINKILFWMCFLPLSGLAQEFKRIPIETIFSVNKKIQFREIFTTVKGDMLITSSMYLAEIYNRQFKMDFPTGGLTDSKGNPQKISGNNIFKDAYDLHTGFKCIAGGHDDIIYLVSDNNNFGWIDYKIGKGFSMPPFNFPGNKEIDIRKIWLDPDGDLFIAASDTIYVIKEATKLFKPGTRTLTFKNELDKDGNTVVTEGAKTIKKFSLGKNIIPYCFTNNPLDKTIYIGTNKGIFEFEKNNGTAFNLFSDIKQEQITITNIYTSASSGYIWFSTLEKGMGSYSEFSKSVSYYPYKTQPGIKNPVLNFTTLPGKEFLVAAGDTLPALFNTETYRYEFINDTSFHNSKNIVSDIKTGAGNFIAIIKGGELYISTDFLKNRSLKNNAYPIEPYIKEILIGGKTLAERINYQTRYDSVKDIHLKYYDNHIDILFAARGVASTDTVVFAWKMDGLWNGWQDVPLSIMDERMNMVNFDLKPGTYVFRVKMKNGKDDWLKQEVALTIIIESPFWQTWWFWALVIQTITLVIYMIVQFRVRAVRKFERQRAKHEKQLLEIEAQALRAQMNPHFIYNCMNSIKALIQNDEKQKSIDYLTTFSKLIRTIFQNSDKRQISLYDEIETCRLYTQLEVMRLNKKLKYQFDIDPNLDLKSVMVPALIVQPFIENAIWHGIVPKDEGMIKVTVKGNDDAIICEVDDNGIGREMSQLNKPVTPVIHESKGVYLSKARLDLEKLLNETQATIETTDKHENGKSTGTKVVITFNLN